MVWPTGSYRVFLLLPDSNLRPLQIQYLRGSGPGPRWGRPCSSAAAKSQLPGCTLDTVSLRIDIPS